MAVIGTERDKVERPQWVDLSSSMVASATAGVGAKPGIQSGRGELLSRVNKPTFADARARGEVAP
jgi:hypothetical protein